MAILEELNKINGVVSPSIMEAIAILKKGGIISKKVTVLPEVGEAGVLYFAPKDGATAPDVYGEYLYVDGAWELLGTAGGGDATDAVKYTEQNLTTAEKMQARKNLDLYRIETSDYVEDLALDFGYIYDHENPRTNNIEFVPRIGQVCVVHFNGEEYESEVIGESDSSVMTGNLNIMVDSAEDTGEPYFILMGTDEDNHPICILYTRPAYQGIYIHYSLGVYHITYSKVPEEYLPETAATKDYVKGVVTGSETHGTMLPSVERYPYTDYYAVCYDENDGTMNKFPIDCVGTRNVKQHNRNVPQWYGDNCLYTDVGEPGVNSFEINLYPDYPDSPVEHSVRASFVFRPSGTNFSISVTYSTEGLSDYVYWEDGHAPSDMTWDNQCIYRLDVEVFPDTSSGNPYAMCKITKLNHVSVEEEAV